jgi:hypothetical protein
MLGAIAMLGARSDLAAPALGEVKQTVDLFKRAASYGGCTTAFLVCLLYAVSSKSCIALTLFQSVVCRLYEHARRRYTQSRNGSSVPKDSMETEVKAMLGMLPHTNINSNGKSDQLVTGQESLLNGVSKSTSDSSPSTSGSQPDAEQPHRSALSAASSSSAPQPAPGSNLGVSPTWPFAHDMSSVSTSEIASSATMMF